MEAEYRQWLQELTSLPTAAGREDAVVAWVTRWVKQRRTLELLRDKFGNLTIKRRRAASRSPIYITAHMDHPSFVVTSVRDARHVVAEFRGGVADEYFVGSRVVLHHGDTKVSGVVREFGHAVGGAPASKSTAISALDKCAVVEFDQDAPAAPGDVTMWDVGPTRVEGDRLLTTACDDLAGVASAIAALDAIYDPAVPGLNGKANARELGKLDVRVLLTRAEEVGFIGAIAACKARTMPKASRLICLENSKSFAESPIGGGPIVRVGDRVGTFDPGLTYQLSQLAARIAERDSTFRWQRKLMPGGTCEASAFQALGYTASCLCLPLGNYHNMTDERGVIGPETISLTDFDGLVRLLVVACRSLDDAGAAPNLPARLDELFKQRSYLLR